ncbi:Conserved_hypothetical protein [Hexamita inflata]|uniref:Uncharacterized protein n=1 Tax=Hexamita inflata TaxID=28002 RepID=A0AA86TSJ5_9EUKA|nr:Conserved hypothetical protein [Hexamita inflata]
MQNKIYSLEKFVFNMATLFLTPKEMFYFKIFVLANRCTNREKPVHVFNHAHMLNYIQHSSVPEEQLKEIDEEAKHSEQHEIDQDIISLFQKGFIVRYAKYDISKIEFRTPLTFRATNFVKHFHNQLKALARAKIQEQKEAKELKGSKYICNYETCKKGTHRHTKTKYRLQLQVKTSSSQTVLYAKNKEQLKRIKKTNTAKMIAELQNYMNQYLIKACAEDKDYLERKLRAMRTAFNDKIIVQWEDEQKFEPNVDRRMIFNNQQKALKEIENLKKERLNKLSKDRNINSVLRKIGPVFNAPRQYQSGLVENQKPEWLEGVYKRAENIIKKYMIT